MKTKLTLLAAGVFFLCTSWIAKAPLIEQTKSENRKVVPATVSPEFSFFRTHRQGKAGITATWGLNSESGVQTFTLERTDQDPTDPYSPWETICILPCSNGRSYKFTDANVFPGFISYRVKVGMANGSEMMSSVSTIHIVSH